MITTDTCLRCAGQLYTETDRFGTFTSCLQCGYLTAIDGYDPEAKRAPKPRGHYRKNPLRGQTYNQRHR